jgi:alanine racemase
VCPVIKANAYGHGAEELCGILTRNGVTRVAVATVAEVQALRARGYSCSILLLGSLHPSDAAAAAAAAATPVLSSVEGIKAWAAALRANPRAPNKAHLKIDTGMRRNGIAANEVLTYITCAAQAGVVLEGVMSHFSSADDNYEYTQHQTKLFADAVGTIPKELRPSVQHICGTAGLSHTSHVTRHTSHVTRHTSHVTSHTSHVTRHTSHVTRHTSHITRHTSHITHHVQGTLQHRDAHFNMVRPGIGM